MRILKRIFNRTKHNFPRVLSNKEKWCLNIIKNDRGKYHKDVGKKAWFLHYEDDELIIKGCTIKAYYSSLEPDGTRTVMIVENDDGSYDDIGMYYFLAKPHKWVTKLDWRGRSDYREVQNKILKYKNLSEGGTFKKEIEFWTKKLENFEPEMTKQEFRESRLKKLLN